MKTKKKRSRKIGRIDRIGDRIKRTMLYWLNPKTNNLVGYPRAHALHLDTRKGVKMFIEVV